ncbi:hypothetical protein GTR02_21590, partial [Kineococcus sp. R8]
AHPSAPSRDLVVGEGDLRTVDPLVLRGLVDTPPHDLAAADDLLLRIGRLQAVAEPLLEAVEHATGLRRQVLFVLQAVDQGHVHARAIGRQVGADTATVQAWLDRLGEQGHLRAAPLRPGDRHVELTDSGRAVLEHVEAMTLRSTDALLQLIGPERARDVAAALEVLVEALTVPAAAGAAGAPLVLPAGQPRSLRA